MCSSSWVACHNTAWNTAFPSGPPAKLEPFFPTTSGIIWECNSPRSTSPTAWKSFLAALPDRDTEIHQNMLNHLSFLLPNPVNVTSNCYLCSELLCYSFRGFKWIFSWQHLQDYTCTGLGEKKVFSAVGVGHMAVTGPEMDVLQIPLSLHCQRTWFRQGQNPGLGFQRAKCPGTCLPSCSIPAKVKSLILRALENVVPRCCHSKSPAMCLNPMQDMQSSFLRKQRIPVSLFLKIAIMSLLRPPMHSATVNKICSDLMSTAPGATFLWGRDEQSKEAKSALLWWLLSCP